MAFRDTLERVLSAGLASELDGIARKKDPNSETTAPTGTAVDRIPGLNFFGVGPNGGAITANTLVMLALLGAGILGAVYLIRR